MDIELEAFKNYTVSKANNCIKLITVTFGSAGIPLSPLKGHNKKPPKRRASGCQFVCVNQLDRRVAHSGTQRQISGHALY